jgi:hypothetical protein
VAALAEALAGVLDGNHDPARIAAAAPGSWDDSASSLRQVLEEAAREHGRAPSAEAAA